MNPAQAFANRTARLAREDRTPVFTSETGVKRPKRAREHTKVVEVESDMGGRYWSKPMPESAVMAFIKSEEEIGYSVSDIDCAFSCFCTPDED